MEKKQAPTENPPKVRQKESGAYSLHHLTEPTPNLKLEHALGECSAQHTATRLSKIYRQALYLDINSWNQKALPLMWVFLWQMKDEERDSHEFVKCAATIAYWWNRTSKIQTVNSNKKLYKKGRIRGHDKDAKVLMAIATGAKSYNNQLRYQILKLFSQIVGFLVDSIENTVAKTEWCEHRDTRMLGEESPEGGVTERCNICGKSRLHIADPSNPEDGCTTEWAYGVTSAKKANIFFQETKENEL